jgi:prephenate dehydrogenase
MGLLLDEAGITFRAFDPMARVPGDIAADSLESLVNGAAFVVVAVPLPATRQTLLDLRPHLVPQQIVLDVGSVKVMPAEAMAEVLGSAIPWVATHPLFGPTCLARGQLPLDVVVCPNPIHPRAVSEVRRLYESIDCQIIEKDPEDHDRIMAYTHALTYFMAKGMLDIGLEERMAGAPPSFRAMTETIEAVRSDAGHLFSAIHRQNPFAGEARRRLLQALEAIDEQISESAVDLDIVPTLHGEALVELYKTRTHIDAVDRELINLLGRRAKLSMRAGSVKNRMGREIHDPDREAELLEARRLWGQEVDVDQQAIDDIFADVLRFSKRLQKD